MKHWMQVGAVVSVVIIGLSCFVFLVWLPAARQRLNDAMWEALDKRDVRQAAALIKRGADPNAPGRDTMPLYWAVEHLEPDLAALLLERGADPNAKSDGAGGTPLYLATAYWHPHLVEILLRYGADPNARMRDTGKTALHRAVRAPAERAMPLAELLLAHGADPNARDNSGASPLLGACFALLCMRTQLVENVQREEQVVGLLLSYGAKAGRNEEMLIGQWDNVLEGFRADPSAVNRPVIEGYTPLHIAVAGGHAEAVECLLSLGADVHARECLLGETPLLVGFRQTTRPIVELLLDAGADINASGETGRTLLHWVAEGFCPQLDVGFLIDHGAARDAQDKSGQTPLDTAIRAWLLRTRLGRDGLPTAPCRDAALALFARGATAQVVSQSGLKGVEPGVVALLQACGVNHAGSDREGYLAIHHAVASGEIEAVELLIEYGADLAAATADGDTPLHIAARTGNAALVRLLLSHGASPAIKNHSGLTPSDCAAGHPDVLQVLGQGASD